MSNPLSFLVDACFLSIVSISLEGGFLCLTLFLGLVVGSCEGVQQVLWNMCEGDNR